MTALRQEFSINTSVSATQLTRTDLIGRGVAQMVRASVHVDLVGSFTPEMREADDDVLKRARIFVDHRQTTKRSGEFLGPFERGIISASDVRGDLFELTQGKVKGRQSASDITLMKNGGGAHLDYYVAKYIVDRYRGRPFTTSSAS